jgi:hypothetical protein
MKLAKLIKLFFLSSPLAVASMLVITKPAEASIVSSAPAQPHLTLASTELASESVTGSSSQESNPILDQMGCSCSTCVKAKLELQGILPLSQVL